MTDTMDSTTAPPQSAAWRETTARLALLEAECAALRRVARAAEAMRALYANWTDSVMCDEVRELRAALDALPDDVRGRL